ncbi:MAG: response regulator [Pseudomonadota bacterium]|nr:response regulator [Pseudomonadota bacterium]
MNSGTDSARGGSTSRRASNNEFAVRDRLREILVNEGYAVELVETASHAREARQRRLPDLVLLDVVMPDIDGIALLTEWRASAELNMPVVMLTAVGNIEMAVEAIRGGAVDVIEKPIALQKLLQTVKRWVPEPRARVERAAERALDRHAAAPLTAISGVGARTAVASALRVQSFGLDRPLRAAREDFEKSYFEYHLAHQNGSMTRVAEKTGIVRTHLYRKLKQLGFDVLRTRRVEDMDEMAADRSSAELRS